VWTHAFLPSMSASLKIKSTPTFWKNQMLSGHGLFRCICDAGGAASQVSAPAALVRKHPDMSSQNVHPTSLVKEEHQRRQAEEYWGWGPNTLSSDLSTTKSSRRRQCRRRSRNITIVNSLYMVVHNIVITNLKKLSHGSEGLSAPKKSVGLMRLLCCKFLHIIL
jgi:hypothetical protein